MEGLREKIEQRGLKLQHVAKVLNLSRYGLSLKLSGKHDFRANEMRQLTELLELSETEINQFFLIRQFNEDQQDGGDLSRT